MHSFTVVIVVRNESRYILSCLESINNCNYPKELIDIVVADDHSTDDTIDQIHSLTWTNLRVVRLNRQENHSPKKSAYLQIIPQLNTDIVACTDGDCIIPVQWFSTMDAYFQSHDIDFVAMPVMLSGGYTFFEQFQQLDFAGMMLITGAGIQNEWLYSANGANMAFRSSIFSEQTYQDNITIPSGDDVFLIQHLSKTLPKKLAFIKDRSAIVTTPVQNTWSNFLQQRVRWGGKARGYRSFRTTFFLFVVYSNCLLITLALLAGLFNTSFLWIGIVFLMAKGVIDYILLREAVQFFQRAGLLKNYFLMSILHYLYIIGIGTISILKPSFVWKDRRWS